MTMIEIGRVVVEAAITNPHPRHSVRFRLAVVAATTTLVEAAAVATRITREVETTTESEQQLK